MNILETLQRDASGHVEISASLIAGECTLVSIVESLETLLVSKDVNQRCSGVTHLARILTHLPASHLSTDEASFIASFLVDRCKDHFKVMPSVIQCMVAVVRQQNMSDTALTSLVRCLYNDWHTQSLMLEDRLNVFAVYLHVLTSRVAVVCAMGADFVTGFVQSVDGEKEPRCLLLMLRAMHALLAARLDCFAVDENAPLRDELFDVLSCYFPVDFTPPDGGSGHGVTRQLLADSLAVCLTATPLFSDSLIPLVLDKLESDVEEARGDAVDILSRCCNDWPADEASLALRSHVSRLRSTLSRACLYHLLSSSQLASLLNLITRITCLLTPGSSDEAALWCQPLTDQCLHLLCQPESPHSVRPAVDLLVAIAAAGSASLVMVLHAAVTAVCDQLERCDPAISSSSEWRAALFYSIAKLLHVQGARACLAESLTSRLALLITSVISAADLQLLTSAVSVLVSASWLMECSGNSEMLTITCRQLCQLYTDQSTQCDTTCLSAISACVTSLYREYTECVTMVILRPLLDSLVSDDTSCQLTDRQLQLVAACSPDAAGVRVSVPLLCVRLMKSGRSMCVASCLQTLSALQSIVSRVCDDQSASDAIDCLLDEVCLLEKMFDLLVSAARDVDHDPRVPLIESASSYPLHSASVVESVGRLLATLVRCLDGRRARDLVLSCVSLFLQQDGAPRLKVLAEKWHVVVPLVHQSPWQHTQLVILLAHVIGAADMSHFLNVQNGSALASGDLATTSDTQSGPSQAEHDAAAGSVSATGGEDSTSASSTGGGCPLPQLPVLSGLLTRLALKKPHQPSSLWSARLLALLFNKLTPQQRRQEDMDRLLEQIAAHCRQVMSHRASANSATVVLSLWTSLTRGLLLAGHWAAEGFVGELLDWLDEDGDLGRQVADAMAGLIGGDDCEDLLSRPNHCHVRLLYKQWLFSVVWRRLVEGNTTTSDADGNPSSGGLIGDLSIVKLTVLGSMLTALPPAAVVPYLPRLVAPLAAGLELLLESSASFGEHNTASSKDIISSSSKDVTGCSKDISSASKDSSSSSSKDTISSSKDVSISSKDTSSNRKDPGSVVSENSSSSRRAGLACLQLMIRTAEQRPQLLEQHVDTLVPRLLTLAESCSAGMTIRSDSLRCVWRMASLTVHRILPMRSDVLRRLQTCLGDHKRLVRQQAVGASNAWYLVGAASDSKTT